MAESLIGIVVGVGLAASCGFRVFVPLLVMSIAAKAGELQLDGGWSWIASWPAIVCFGVATLFEIGGYFIPWGDTLLDAAASPAAVIAGTIATAACVSDMSPWLQWSIAIIIGGGTSGAVQTATVAVRGASTAATGGIANPILALVEMIVSAILSLMAIVAPILALILLGIVMFFLIRRYVRRRAARQSCP